MRRSITTATLALITVGLVAAGTMPAQAATSPIDTWGHHDIGRLTERASALQAARVPGGLPPTAMSPVTVAEHLAGPLNFAVGKHGSLYVGQSNSGVLTLVAPGKKPRDLVTAPDTDIEAVSLRGTSLTWSETTFGPDGPATAVVKQQAGTAAPKLLVDTMAYERAHNSDSVNTYGFRGLTPACLATVPPPLQPYTGVVDSHPYGAVEGRFGTYVADAGSNSILKIDPRGRVSTLAVLPGRAVAITAEAAAGLGLDPCVVGHEYVFEPVPTDIEIGPDGQLYVTGLPGGPEDGSTGANGSVYRVSPKTGAIKLIATGFAGATNLAIAPNGTVYVAELFGDRVSAISRDGVVTPLVSLTQPAGLEWARGRLYVSTNVFGDGSIVSLKVH